MDDTVMTDNNAPVRAWLGNHILFLGVLGINSHALFLLLCIKGAPMLWEEKWCHCKGYRHTVAKTTPNRCHCIGYRNMAAKTSPKGVTVRVQAHSTVKERQTFSGHLFELVAIATIFNMCSTIFQCIFVDSIALTSHNKVEEDSDLPA